MNKLAVCVFVVAGALSVSANGWGAYGDSDIGCGHGAAQTVLVQGGHGGGGGWGGSSGGWGNGGGWAGGAGVAPGNCGEQPANVIQLKPIVVAGKKAKIIEHHSRPIYIKPTVTRFVVPAAPVIIKPVLIHKPSSVSIRPKLLTSTAPSHCMSPVLLRVIKNIEQPSTQRTVILEKSAPASSCNIEASQIGYTNGGCGGGAGCVCGGSH